MAQIPYFLRQAQNVEIEFMRDNEGLYDGGMIANREDVMNSFQEFQNISCDVDGALFQTKFISNVALPVLSAIHPRSLRQNNGNKKASLSALAKETVIAILSRLWRDAVEEHLSPYRKVVSPFIMHWLCIASDEYIYTMSCMEGEPPLSIRDEDILRPPFAGREDTEFAIEEYKFMVQNEPDRLLTTFEFIMIKNIDRVICWRLANDNSRIDEIWGPGHEILGILAVLFDYTIKCKEFMDFKRTVFQKFRSDSLYSDRAIVSYIEHCEDSLEEFLWFEIEKEIYKDMNLSPGDDHYDWMTDFSNQNGIPLQSYWSGLDVDGAITPLSDREDEGDEVSSEEGDEPCHDDESDRYDYDCDGGNSDGGCRDDDDSNSGHTETSHGFQHDNACANRCPHCGMLKVPRNQFD